MENCRIKYGGVSLDDRHIFLLLGGGGDGYILCYWRGKLWKTCKNTALNVEKRENLFNIYRKFEN